MFHLYDSKKSYNYVPDFFLDNKILEIKGSWDDASLNKCYLFNKEYFKQYEFFIIDYDVYYILNKSMSEKTIKAVNKAVRTFLDCWKNIGNI